MSMWVCPCCHKMNLAYEEIEFYDDQWFFPRTCRECWAEWEERYQLEFIWHENINTENCFTNNQKEKCTTE
jgi:hypothetical protein